MNTDSVTIALVDSSAGYEATPNKVRLNVAAEFIAEVQSFLKGETKEIDPAQLDIAFKKGSFAIHADQIPVASSLFTDINHLLLNGSLEAIDKQRRKVIEKWQIQAKGARNIAVRIFSSKFPSVLSITSNTNFHVDDTKDWVEVERYVQGEIQDLGGVRKANAHIRLPNGKSLTVATDRQLLEKENENRVYRTTMLRIKAKLNLHTGELADAKLIEFVKYSPKEDEDLSLLHSKGKEAWKDIENPTAWLENLRGGSEN